MLDAGSAIDILDIEDLVVKEKLERIFEILHRQIERVEDNDGVFVYKRTGKRSLET